MKRFSLSLALILAAALAIVPVASAHTPLQPGDNASLAAATPIPDARKSWALYAELPHAASAQYYRFEATKGERVPIQLFTSPAEQGAGFVPSFVLMGPGIPNVGAIPTYVESPPNAGRMLVAGAAASQGTYEPFSPSAYFSVASTDAVAPVDGTYYVAVFDDQRGGRYGIAVGQAESFTLAEWITTPLAFFRIYQWEGQNPLLVYLPAFLVVAVGVGLLARAQRKGRSLDLPAWFAAIAGLAFIGSGVTVLMQMLFSLMHSVPDAGVIATLVLAGLPLAVGAFTLMLAIQRSGRWTIPWRIVLALLGLVALAVWAGWIVAPALAVIAAFLPSRGGQRNASAPAQV